MRVAIFGANGLLGRALAKAFSSDEVFVVGHRNELDVTDAAALSRYCDKIQPEVMINAAAYNAVDEAEINPESARQAFRVNAYAVGCFTKEAWRRQNLFVHFSTDYVF